MLVPTEIIASPTPTQTGKPENFEKGEVVLDLEMWTHSMTSRPRGARF